MTEVFPLTEAQKEIAEAPPDQSLIVLAPPGTGKTHTVVGRVLFLLEKHGLHPASELAVLCFTRAAVREITERLARLVEEEGYHDDLRFATIRTFDSFATRLLVAAEPEIDLSNAGYDDRIRLAISALSDPDHRASRIASAIEHLIVDEIQDLVGVRAELVRKLIQRIPGGYTLLGDPAQAIYGFALEEEGGLSSDDLLGWAREYAPKKPEERSLNINYRSSGKLAGFATGVRETILKTDEKDVRALRRLQSIIAGLDSSGTPLEPDRSVRSEPNGSICVLCRTNGEVLQVANMLSSKQVGYHLRPRPEDSGLPSWVARVLGTWRKRTLPKSVFLERWRDLVGTESDPDPEEAWRLLKRVEGSEGNSLDVRELHRKFYKGNRLPDDADAYLQPGRNDLHISTIHSAKGREFDHIVVLPPEIDREEVHPLEEARVLYVAATRARERLTQFERKGIPRLWKFECSGGNKRWLAYSPRQGYYFIELGLKGDFERGSSVSTYVNPDQARAERAQQFLWTGVKPGDEVQICKQNRPSGRIRHSFFRVYHESDTDQGLPLGQLSKEFKFDMKGALNYVTNRGRFSYPGYFKGIRVTAVVTEVLSPYPEHIHRPYADSGFCLGIRLRGMGYLWKQRRT